MHDTAPDAFALLRADNRVIEGITRHSQEATAALSRQRRRCHYLGLLGTTRLWIEI